MALRRSYPANIKTDAEKRIWRHQATARYQADMAARKAEACKTPEGARRWQEAEEAERMETQLADQCIAEAEAAGTI